MNGLRDNFKDATWDIDSKSQANSSLQFVTYFELIVVFHTVFQYISRLAGVTVKLQSNTMDIIETYKHTDGEKRFYKEIRGNANLEFHVV